ncbi:diguanylate cyclase [Acetobacter ghanensis]|uniref:Diguanylate cyclase DosC n=2 Tax=Acetobacter ghanensis TaxID=431306 RepID=A0A0U5F857_9PROT|nr:diguanylate cyclase [Acetobacter ghanensis]CEF57273.1 diguanylate cyclase [Acetobacter ghanensis]
MSPAFMNMSPLNQLKETINGTPGHIRQILRSVVQETGPHCVDLFYKTLFHHERAAIFLEKETVEVKMRPQLLAWIQSLFSTEADQAEDLSELQCRIGAVHARLDIPTDIVVYGIYIIKQALVVGIKEATTNKDDVIDAIIYLNTMMDFAFKFMIKAYDINFRKKVESDEAFRLVSLGHNISYEKETQISTFSSWSTQAFFCLCKGHATDLPTIAESEFGLWLTHKGMSLFKGTHEATEIQHKVRDLDTKIEAIQKSGVIPPEFPTELHATITNLTFLIGRVFRHLEEVENGRDPLTKVFNRRFLEVVIQNEITFALTHEKPFSLVILDIDHFKKINDRFGHLVGDEVLCFVAEIIAANVRANDFIFRYGGEEFLVVLTETTTTEALACAERIRRALAEQALTLSSNDKVTVTLSGGVTSFAGETNSRLLIHQADEALYKAKNSGRNRIVTA